MSFGMLFGNILLMALTLGVVAGLVNIKNKFFKNDVMIQNIVTLVSAGILVYVFIYCLIKPLGLLITPML